MKDFKQLTLPSDLLMLTEEQMGKLWKWANRTKFDRPPNMGINGMPLLSVGRCIEFLIDHQIPMKELMASLASDFHNTPDAQLLDILWSGVCIVLAKPEMRIDNAQVLKSITPNELKPRGSMQQWISAKQWKDLTETEMARVWAWAQKIPTETPRVFYNVSSRPMLSVGRLLELLVDHGMTLKEIFQQCMLCENKEWNKMQLIEVLWERVKLVLKAPLHWDSTGIK